MYRRSQFAEAFFNESNDAMFIVDPTSLRILDVNATVIRLVGWSRQHLLEATIDQLIRPRSHGDGPPLFAACRETRFFHSIEDYSLVHKDGKAFEVNLTVNRLHAEEDALALIVARDISIRKRAENKLRETNAHLELVTRQLRDSQARLLKQEREQALEELAGGIAHDLNNSLTPIVTLCQVLLKRDSLDDDLRECLSLMYSAGKDAARMVQNLSVFLPSPNARQKSIDVREILQQMPMLIESRPDNNDEPSQTIDLEFSDVPNVLADESELRRVFSNLTLNAVAAQPKGGVTKIRVAPDKGNVVVEISDSGVGMSEVQIQKCFDPFFTTKHDGSGLGLTVSRQLINRHGGEIAIHSEEGSGTTVRVTIPVSSEDAPKDETIKADKIAAPIRVLYIDDDLGSRESAKAMLSSLGVRVDVAQSAGEGLSLFAAHDFDAVITDYTMPKVNGDHVLQRVKDQNANMPVILISGRDSSYVLERLETHHRPDHCVPKVEMGEHLPEILAQLHHTRF